MLPTPSAVAGTAVRGAVLLAVRAPAAWAATCIALGASASPFGAAAAPASEGLEPSQAETRVHVIPGTAIEFAMVLLPGGEFELGSLVEEPGRDADEGPAVRTTVSPFWMGVHEVTDDEFSIFRFPGLDSSAGPAREVAFDIDAISRPSPPYEDPAHGLGKGRHPAAGMTRWAALQYARWLSEKTGRLFRLPTEAEWEYACEAGRGAGAQMADPDGSSGRDAPETRAQPPRLADMAWYASNSEGRFHEVGSKRANPWGVHDLLGNVAEWVSTPYEEDLYALLAEEGATLDPLHQRPPRGRGVVRGGSFGDDMDHLRCNSRQPESPAWKRRDPQIPKSRWWNTDSPHVGFRIVSPAAEHTLEEIRAYWAEVLGS